MLQKRQGRKKPEHAYFSGAIHYCDTQTGAAASERECTFPGAKWTAEKICNTDDAKTLRIV